MQDSMDVTGETLLEAQFDPRVKKYTTGVIVLIMIITVVGIPLIPFALIVRLVVRPLKASAACPPASPPTPSR